MAVLPRRRAGDRPHLLGRTAGRRPPGPRRRRHRRYVRSTSLRRPTVGAGRALTASDPGSRRTRPPPAARLSGVKCPRARRVRTQRVRRSGGPPSGLVDAQHFHFGQRHLDDLAGLGAEGVHPGQTRKVQVSGGLDDGGGGVAYPAPGGTAQPHGDPRAGRYLRHLLGERPARAAGLAAPPASLVPAKLQPAPAVGRSRGRIIAEPFTRVANTPHWGRPAPAHRR
jgi:hypothetical protein